MTPTKLVVVAAFGLSAAACSYSNTTTTAAVPGPYRSGAEQACVDYGFNPGTDSYNRCVVREAQSRAAGRMPADYAIARINADARDACYSYGLEVGSGPYNRCVGREMDARRYRDSTATVYVPATTPAPAYTTVYVPQPSYPPPPTPYVETRNSNTAGVQAFRDEYGFRYDAEGNRLDRHGNIVSPQSTQP